ncbi:essential MCU regulator, mitochondrial isoform X2 [Vidua macroura]|uniref:essential MCU regulator, mitochondrial isoform X2 n=1 Tax=Vidua macroura TaxID=187451 RepID=UPI0023A80A34|nr:essential MCU regulator, mitochondrial isoform X2 [Vidua macroura]
MRKRPAAGGRRERPRERAGLTGPVSPASPRARQRCDTPFGLLRVFSVVIPFLYVGTQISKNFAALLEEHDIFVPEDDDDDD